MTIQPQRRRHHVAASSTRRRGSALSSRIVNIHGTLHITDNAPSMQIEPSPARSDRVPRTMYGVRPSHGARNRISRSAKQIDNVACASQTITGACRLGDHKRPQSTDELLPSSYGKLPVSPFLVRNQLAYRTHSCQPSHQTDVARYVFVDQINPSRTRHHPSRNHPSGTTEFDRFAAL